MSDLFDAWEEGFDAGHRFARAVNNEWPEPPPNPYEREEALRALAPEDGYEEDDF